MNIILADFYYNTSANDVTPLQYYGIYARLNNYCKRKSWSLYSLGCQRFYRFFRIKRILVEPDIQIEIRIKLLHKSNA